MLYEPVTTLIITVSHVSGLFTQNYSMGTFILLGSNMPLRGVANPSGKYSKPNMGDGQLNNVKVI